VYVRTGDELVEHIHELANNITAEWEQAEQDHHGGPAAAVIMRGSVLCPTASTDLEKLFPCIRHRIIEMWSDATGRYEAEPKKIGALIRATGVER